MTSIINKVKNTILNIVKNLVVILLLLTFILPYYAAATTATADEAEPEKGRGAVPTAAGIVLEGITTVTDASKVGSSGTVSTNYPESGDGYNSLTVVNGTKYKNYKQFIGSYAGKAYWDGTMASDACGPTSVAIVASGYGIDKSPYDIASQLSYTGPSVLSNILTKIGISNECKSNSNNSTSINDIRQNLEQGRPVLVGVGAGPDSKYTSGGHWMTLLAINGDTITISNPGTSADNQTDNINTFVSNYLSSYILITQPFSTTSSSSAETGNVVSENSLATDGYTGIYKSGITGKEFKEYKQNGDAPWANESYVNTGSSIGSTGCCLVADCILMSGYGKDMNPSELNSNCGGSYTVGEGIGHVDYFTSASNSEVINHLKSGGTLFSYTHNPTYAVSEHYMAVIDVSSDGKQVYVSNPNAYGPTGWIDADSYLGAMQSYLFIPAGGGSGSYGGSTSSFGYSTSNMSSNISQYIKPNGRGGYKIDIDLDEKVQEMLDLLENNNIKDVDNFLKTSKKEEYLKAMLKTELVTQFPDLRSADEIKSAASKEKVLKDVKANLPDAIKKVALIHISDVSVNEESVSSYKAENQEKLESEITAKLNELSLKGISYNKVQENIYTYIENGTQFKIQKTSDTTYEIYKVNKTENEDEIEQYVFDSLKKKNIQSKIENIITSGNITREAVHDSFYTTISSKAQASGYDITTLENLYFSYINKIRDNLASNNSGISQLFANMFSSSTPNDELQGVIRIKRKSINNATKQEENPVYLSYIPYDEFTQMCNNNDNNVLDHFTINSSGGIIVAQWKTTRNEPGNLVNNQTAIDINEKYKDYMTYSSSYEITPSTPISYLSQIYQHTMPFDLLWTLLVYSGDYDFIYDLANLINNSEIIITALDKISESSQTYTKKIALSNKSEDSTMSNNGNYTTNERNNSSEYATISYTIYTTTCTSELKVSYINSWIAKYTNNSEVLDTPDTKDDEQTVDSSNETTDWEQTSTETLSNDDAFDLVLRKNIQEYIIDYKDSSVDEYTLNRAKNAIIFEGNIIDAYISYLRSGKFVVYPSDKLKGVTRNTSYKFTKEDITGTSNNLTTDLQTKLSIKELQSRINNVVNSNASSEKTKTDLKNAIETILVGIYKTGDWNPQIMSSITTNYTKIDSVDTNLKTNTVTYKYTSTSGQINEKTDPNSDEDNFITLLNKNGRAKGSLRSIAEWMFESIECNRILCDKLDLMKYLLGIAFGRDYDIDESFSFDMFDPKNFQTSSSGEMNGKVSTNLEEFLMTMEGGDQYIDGNDYIVFDIGDGCLNIGHGIVVGYSDGTPWYPDILSSIYAGQRVSKEIYDKIYERVMKGFTDALDASLAKYDLTLKQYQYDAMVSFLYNCGSGASDTIVSAYKNGGDEGYWNETSQWINSGSAFEYGLRRRRAEEYELFTTGDYNYDPDF